MLVSPVGARPVWSCARISPPQQANLTLATYAMDAYDEDGRAQLRRALRRVESRIAECEDEITEARQSRAVARRMTLVMCIATMVTAAATVALSLTMAAPLVAAAWVLPSALGGSAVGQSVVAMQCSVRIRQLESHRDSLIVTAQCLREQLDARRGAVI